MRFPSANTWKRRRKTSEAISSGECPAKKSNKILDWRVIMTHTHFTYQIKKTAGPSALRLPSYVDCLGLNFAYKRAAFGTMLFFLAVIVLTLLVCVINFGRVVKFR